MYFVASFPVHICTSVICKYIVKLVLTWGFTFWWLKGLNIKKFDIS